MKGHATTFTCENCGQAVLQSDIECWHCGAKLKHPEPEPLLLSGELDEGEKVGEGLPLQILFYAAMSAATALALLLVIRSLGQQPRLAASFGADDIPMVALIAPDGSFSIEVPSELVWYFPQAQRGRGAAAAQMMDDPQFEAALQPLFDLAPDIQMLLLAEAGSGILAVARSKQLGQLTVEKVMGSLASEPFPGGTVLAAGEGRNRVGMKLALITLEQEDPPINCRQQFMPDSEGAYLAVICSDPERFEEQSAVFNAILNSLTIR